jgi:gliding motility-associated-like protein
LKRLILYGFWLIPGILPAQNTYFMGNGKVRACEGIFKDSDKGKNQSDYDHNERYIFTISVPGASSITLKFTSFCTEKDNDYLQIYDGKDTSAPKLGPRYSGSTSPGTLKSSDSFITFYFYSDNNIACGGWEASWKADMPVITPPSLSLTAAAKCSLSTLSVLLGRAFPCDSVKASSFVLSGTQSPSVQSVNATNCSGGKATRFNVNLAAPLTRSGTYYLDLTLYFKDFCDSVWTLRRRLTFSITDCPLQVTLVADQDTLCRNSCTWLRATVSGGTPANYRYTWTPGSLSGAGPHRVCPNSTTRYILRVTDGVSIPASDTLDVVVLAPPQAMPDTMVCYLSAPFNLRATPAGGRWFGNGISDAVNGTFSPALSGGGTHKVWYQIGACADTVLVTSTGIWNGDNVFCPKTPPSPLYHVWPTGGTWTGLKVTSNGIFNPDSVGVYRLTYTWKGCTSQKTVRVEPLVVPERDTVCESSTLYTLKFSPVGVSFAWFPGLLNGYWGTINPSLMGGPGNRNIIIAGGGCRDTTVVTILAADAGPLRDTLCPAAGNAMLSGFRPATGFSWKGRGINDSTSALYNPSFFASIGKSTYTDTLLFRAGRCTDVRYITLMPTRIGKKDTVFLCAEDTGRRLTHANQQIAPSGGFWFGKGIAHPSGLFKPLLAGYGAHTVYYRSRSCTDSMVVVVRPGTGIQNDTAVCISSSAFRLKAPLSGGFFAGPGITNAVQGLFNPAVARSGNHRIVYTSRYGCRDTVFVRVDTVPAMRWDAALSVYCLRDTGFVLRASPAGGTFIGNGLSGNVFNPRRAGSGQHLLQYRVQQGACLATLPLDIEVLDTLKAGIQTDRDSLCPDETALLTALASGGDRFSYRYSWNGQAPGTAVQSYQSPTASTLVRLTVSDGCSDPDSILLPLHVFPRYYFTALLSRDTCYGQPGFAELGITESDPFRVTWHTVPPFSGARLKAPAGIRYRATVRNLSTGCMRDTALTIPAYRNLRAAFSVFPQSPECLSNIQPTARFSDMSFGGTTGIWHFGDGQTQLYVPGINPAHTYSSDYSAYRIRLILQNEGGCTDSAALDICMRDTVLVYIPNAFSPNGNNKNEVFLPVLNGAREYRLRIYNLWGEKLFETSDPRLGWDGTFNGKPCPGGVYVYVLEFKGRKTYPKMERGWVSLLR